MANSSRVILAVLLTTLGAAVLAQKSDNTITILKPGTSISAHDYAVKAINHARKSMDLDGMKHEPRVYYNGGDGMESFEIDAKGNFIGHNLSEHDALLLMYAAELEREARLAKETK